MRAPGPAVLVLGAIALLGFTLGPSSPGLADDHTGSVPTVAVSGFAPPSVTLTLGPTGGADTVRAVLTHLGSSDAAQVCTTTTCAFTGLGPGTWRLEVTEGWNSDGATSRPLVSQVTIPSTPSVAIDATFGIAGVGGRDGDSVRITDGSGATVCTTTVAGGIWACSVASAPTSPGTHHYHVLEFDPSGTRSSWSADALYTVPAGSTSGTPALGSITKMTPGTVVSASLPTLATWSFDIVGIDLGDVHPGDRFTVTGSQLPPGSLIAGELHSAVVSLGSVLVQSDGSFALPVTVPADFSTGAHELVLTLTDPSGIVLSSEKSLTVTPAGSRTEPQVDPSQDPAAQSGAGGTSTDPLGSEAAIGASNILTHGLNSIADVLQHPQKIVSAVQLGLVLLIFGVLPGHLLNATLAEQYTRLSARRPHLRRRTPAWYLRLHAALNRAPFLAGLALTTVTALLFGFADPRFGFTLASVRLVLGLAIALAIVTYGTNVVVGRIMRARWAVDVQISLRPLGLILTVIGVVVSRALDFSPGFLVGLVLGLVIAEKSLKEHAWKAVLLRTSILLGLALTAWLAFSLFDSRSEGGTFASELAVETLVAITTEAVVGLLVDLLPLQLLDGQKLYARSRLLWGVLYLVALVIFVVAVVPWEGNWAELGTSLWTWLGIVVGFGILATGVYVYFRVRSTERPAIPDEVLVPIASEPDGTDPDPE